jgi:hypothetical protein
VCLIAAGKVVWRSIVAQIKKNLADFEREQLGRGGARRKVSISQRQEMIAANVFVS